MTQFLRTLIEISLVASVLIGALLLLSPLLRKKYAPRSLCLVWLVLSVRLLVPFSPHLTHSVITIPTPLYSAAVVQAPFTAAAVPGTLPAGPQDAVTAGTQAPWRPSGAELAVAVWAAGALSMALAHLLGYYLLRRNIRRCAIPYYDENGLAMFRRLSRELGIPDGRVALLFYPKAGSPMLTGFLHPAILLPESGDDISSLALILRHELTHYRRKHLWFKLLLECCKIVHWFNPLVWLMARDAGKDLENVCDRAVIGTGDLLIRKKYSETILSAMARDHARHIGLSTYYHGGKNTMKQRFTGIFDMSVKKRGTAVIAVVLLAVLASSALLACGTPTVVSSPSPSPSAASSASANAPATPASPSPTGAVHSPATAAPSPTAASAPDTASAPTAASAPAASAPSAASVPTFSFLKSLIGMSKQELLSAFNGITPEPVDEGGLGFDKVGIRVWFDETYTKVAQVIIMSDKISIDGVKVGENYKAFTDKFGTPISDTNGDAHFKYGSIWLSVVRDTATDKVIAVYILAQNF